MPNITGKPVRTGFAENREEDGKMKSGWKTLVWCAFAMFCLLALLLTGCGKNGSGENQTDASGRKLSEIERKWQYINENMERYNIIFSTSAPQSETQMIRAFSGTVIRVTGKSATLRNDAYTEIPADEVGEIIIGVTNRLGSRYQSSIVDSELADGTYRIEYIGKDVIVHYNGIDGLSNAILELLGYMAPGNNVDTVFLNQLEKVGFSLGDVHPKNIYTNGMMLQRNRVTTFIGVSEPGIELTAKLLLNGEPVASGSCISEENGNWDLPMMMPDGSYNIYDLVFYVKNVPVCSFTNILVGELWIATGQSNMAYTVAKDVDYSNQNFNDPYIRVLHCTIPSGGYSAVPIYENPTSMWYMGNDPTEMAGTTAIGYYFAKQLRADLDMPVGLIYYAVGGTPIRAWLSQWSFSGNKDLLDRYQSNGWYVTEADWDPNGSRTKLNCSALYNSMTCAMQGLTIGGVIWYQGEQDLGETDPYYATELELLWNQFRYEFGWADDENLPFVFPDLMPYFATRNPMFQSEIAIEMEQFYLAHPNAVSLIQISDASPEFNSNNNASHPNSKYIAGTRMAKAAYCTITGTDRYPSSSPIFASARKDGNAIIVKLDNVADGLCLVPDTAVTLGDTELHGFTICGPDGVYVMARAEIISKDEVRVWNDEIANPVGVSYCYGFLAFYSNLGCLYNGELLYMTLPFCYNAPSGAKQLSWIPWADCDQSIIWRVSRSSTHFGAYQYAWSASGAELTYSGVENAFEGANALALAYNAGKFSISPNFSGMSVDGEVTYKDITTDFTPYKRVTFVVRNDGTAPVTFDSLCASGSAFFTSTSGTIPADGQWYRITVDLTKATSRNGSSISADTYLKPLTSLTFAFTGVGEGTLYFDNVEFLP